MKKTHVILMPWPSAAFPVNAIVRKYGYSAVFGTVEEAKTVVEGRFGACSYTDRTTEGRAK